MTNRPRVLLFDHDKTYLLVLSQYLENEYELVLANDIYQAVGLVGSASVDLVVIDLSSNTVAGFNLFSVLKNENYQVPVVFLHNEHDVTLEEECFNLGCADFILKSSRMIAIKKRLKSVIDLSLLRTQNVHINSEANQRIESIQQHIIESFSSIIEGRDTSTGMHIKRTAAYVDMVLSGLTKFGYYTSELTPKRKEAIIRSAPLHDIGKIVVPDMILCKPGKLTKEEFEVMKCHALEGGKLIKETLEGIENTMTLQIAVNMATYHHERWGGGGYPYSLMGEEIPLCARVMAIADVFDALVSKRCYKDSFSYEQSFKIIEDETGTHFDPKISEVFLSMKDDVVNISESWSL